MSQSKPLIMPWLRDQINSGRYPGVTWMNPGQTEFCIPWKHALRQDSSSDDILIFKAWAEVSKDRAKGDPSVWKRNFRSALRAKGFKTVSDSKNDAANPHKVYRWPGEITSGASPSEGSQESEDLYRDPFASRESGETGFIDTFFVEGTGFTDPSSNQDILKKCMEDLNIEALDFQPIYQPGPVEMVREVLLPDQQPYPMDGAMDEATGGVGEQQYMERLLSLSKTMSGENNQTFFRVVVYYRGMKVSEQLVQNEAGLKLVYRPDLTQPYVDHQTGLSVVSLPSLGPLADQQQAGMTQRILDSLGEGLELRLQGSEVLGQRRGDSRVYWSLCKFDNSKMPQEVSKNGPQALYYVKDFIQGLLNFFDGGESPSFSLFFCLGEKWPDPNGRPWVKKLVLVEVVLTAFETLKLLAVAGGASSLQSVELQLSLQEMMVLG